MRLIFITLLALALATVVGLGATWMTATRGTDLGTLTIGAWTARPKTGTADVDPYSRASIARSGELPIGTGDGVAFSATTRRQEEAARRPLRRRGQRRDAGGAVLDADAVRHARDIWWPIRCSATASPARKSSAAPTARSRSAIASRSRAGNWLPTGGIERYALMLRLYDTPVGVATRTQRDAPMPSITTVGCP